MAIGSGFYFKVIYVIYFFKFIIIFCDLVIYHPTCILLQMTNCLAHAFHARADNSIFLTTYLLSFMSLSLHKIVLEV